MLDWLTSLHFDPVEDNNDDQESDPGSEDEE